MKRVSWHWPEGADEALPAERKVWTHHDGKSCGQIAEELHLAHAEAAAREDRRERLSLLCGLLALALAIVTAALLLALI